MKTNLEHRIIGGRAAVAKDNGVSLSTVRSWDEMGIIRPIVAVGKIKRYDLIEVRRQLANISK